AKLDTAFEQWLRFCTQQPELCAAHDPRTEFERSARSFVLSARAVRDLLAEANEQDLNEQVDEVIAQHESWSSIAVQLLSELASSTEKTPP
ncbi:MAG: hypothetical protein RBU37_04955, partial [Myxococcota bacterium]|nr:hypothetical protein [Myxococcota bacterium]